MRRVLPIALAALTGCGSDAAPSDGDATARASIAEHGCATCHVVPGIAGPGGSTGPPLTAMARQVYVAGVLPNTPEDLATFIVDPQAVDPRSAMPNLGVTPEEAAAMAAFLHRVSAR